MKIGILTEIINYHSGARAPLETAKHLAKRGHQITIYGYVFGQDKYTLQDLRNHAVSVKMFNKPRIAIIGKYISALSLFKSLRKNQPQVILFSGTLPFFLAAKLLGIPIIWIYMGTQFDAILEQTIPDQNVPSFTKVLNKIANLYIFLVGIIIFRLSTSVVAISKYAANEGKRLYRRNVSEVIYFGTTRLSSRIKNDTIKKTSGSSLLAVSRITPYKGFHLIVEAMKKVKANKKVILTIVGSQPKQGYVEYLKKIGGKNIDIIIDPTDQKLAKLYQKSDIYVTADRYLYFGLPIVEAAQFSKPAVSFNFAAASELVEHGKTGFIAKNLQDFARYMTLLIEDDHLRERLGRNAKQRSKQFSWEKCAQEWEKVIETILRKKV